MSEKRDSDRPTKETVAVRAAPTRSIRPRRFSLSTFEELHPVCEIRGYYVVGRISKSATGETYLAYKDTPVGRQWYSLKLLSDLVERQPELLAKVDQEISRSEAISYPSLVSVVETIAAASQRLVVLPWIRGAPLSAVLAQTQDTRGLRWDLAVSVFRQVSNALSQVCEDGAQGVRVHGAIIPQNIVIDSDGGVYVLNLGLDVLRAGAQDLTIVYPFRAPEIRRSGKSSAAADVFGVGVCLLELIEPGAAAQILDRPDAVAELVDKACSRHSFPQSLAALIKRAVAIDPAHRFVSVASLATALEGVPLVLTKPDLQRELVAELRAHQNVGFDLPPAMETASLRIAALAEKARLGDLPADTDVVSPGTSRADPTERSIVAEHINTAPETRAEEDAAAMAPLDSVVAASRKPRWVLALAGLLVAASAVGVWAMTGDADETSEQPLPVPEAPASTALGHSATPKRATPASAKAPGERPAVAAKDEPPAKMEVDAFDAAAAIAEGEADLDDAFEDPPDAALEHDDLAETPSEIRVRPQRRRVEPKRRPQKKILSDPGF